MPENCRQENNGLKHTPVFGSLRVNPYATGGSLASSKLLLIGLICCVQNLAIKPNSEFAKSKLTDCDHM